MPVGLNENPVGLVDPACPLDWSHPLNRGLVGCYSTLPNPGWSGGLTLRNITGVGNNGTASTLFGGSYSGTWVTGKNSGERALKLQSANWDYMSIPTSVALDRIVSTNKLTGSIWIKPTTAAVHGVLGAISVATSKGWCIITRTSGSDTTIDANVGEATGSWFGASGLIVNGTWVMVTLTYNGSVGKIYINGIETKSVSKTSDFATGINAAVAGSFFGTATFNGVVAHARIYSRNLTATEVQALYQEQLRGSPETLRWVGATSYFFPVQEEPVATVTAGGGNTPMGMVDPACPIEWSHPLNRGLVGCWQTMPNSGWIGGNKSYDLVRGGKKPNNGTLTGGAVWSKRSAIGSRGSISFPSNTSTLPFTGQALTVWTIYFRLNCTSFTPILDYFGGSVNDQTEISNQSGGGSAGGFFAIGRPGFYNPSGFNNNALVAGRWYGIAVTVDASNNVIYYVNGLPDSSPISYGVKDTTLPTSAAWSSIQNSREGSNGLMDGMRIYNRVLSASEIAALHQEQLRGSPETLRWVGAASYGLSSQAAPATGNLFRYSNLSGLQGGGPFFVNPLGA